jgi:hypothetical protein
MVVGLLVAVAVAPIEVSISFEPSVWPVSPMVSWLSRLLLASSLLLGCTGFLLERRSAIALAAPPFSPDR